MTKKHFISLADLIRDQFELNAREVLGDDNGARGLDHDAIPKPIRELAWWSKTQNDRFDRERWYGYIYGTCGPNGGKRHAGEREQ